MQPNSKVAFYTLGCKLNFSESSTIARSFIDAGYARVEFNETPDVFVINTCSVTENADKKCKQLVRKAKQINPNSYVAIIGCYAQLKPDEILEMQGVDMVLGAGEKFNLVAHVEANHAKEKTLINGKITEVREFIPGFSMGDRTRSFLKVQDGCDYFCSFCTIPLARGRSRSTTIAETVLKAQEIAQTDVKEVVLTGVNIGDFGILAHSKQGERTEDFLGLCKALDKVEGIDRFRISSIEPNLLSNEIIDFVANSKKFVPHFHIPLQSGSDTMLKSMRRRYDVALYTERVNHILSVMPHCCIGVDVIVGYPGETDEEFKITQEYLSQLPVSYLHVFTYSERANTTATRMENVVPVNIRRERSKQLRFLSYKLKKRFYDSQIGNSYPVLFESDDHDGQIHGFTSNYVKVQLPYNKNLCNTIQTVQLKENIGSETVKCELLQKSALV